ncbi:MAG: gliding motility-associated ABC transporter ATP-binding subunit GldA [Bacteroidetes bacterium]|nr:gliding motility-associated ABC transporter ATP-binding subunit GldA [Bacteroidota bacterium]
MSVIVEKLTKTYEEQRAVDEVSFEINQGEIVGFLGPNGAGKSTTMKMLTCYLAPTSGTASVGGKSILTDSLEVRKRIGYLPEHNPLYLEMYVKEYLRFIAGLHNLKGNVTKRVNELIDMTGLGVEKNKKIAMLSKGYRQRVGLAQALLHDPEVLILDEPTSGLDPNQIVEIRNLIKEAGSNKTVIFSTHILQEAEAMCSRIIIINKGKIVADKPTEVLINSMQGLVQMRVVFKNAVQANDLKQLEGVSAAVKQNDGYLINSSDKNLLSETLFNFAVKTGNVVYEMTPETQSLEKIFQELTQTEKQ